MQNDREARQSLGDFFEDVETQRWRYQNTFFVSCALFGFELVGAVAGTDGNGQ